MNSKTQPGRLSSGGGAPAAALLALGLVTDVATAGGIYVPMKGATASGLANVGMASLAEDGSTLFYNPAGMTRLGAAFVEFGADVVNADLSIANRGSSANTLGSGSAQVQTLGPKGQSSGWTPVPNLFVGAPLSGGDVWLGLAVTAPFGLQVSYASDWFGRYDSFDNELTTLNVAPTAAYRINDAWSIGAGIDFQFADAKLISALPDPLNPGGPTAATDGRSKLTGTGWSTGFNIGLLFQPNEGTRMGLHYRSGIQHRLQGDLELSGLSGPLVAANGRSSSRTRLNLPDMLSLSLTQMLSPRWMLLGEVQWFGWDAFDEIRVQFSDGSPDLVRAQGFENSYTAGLAIQYRPTTQWTLRGGIQYDQSPTTDALRNTSIPDSDLTWLGIGASYNASKRLRLDLGYVYGSFARADIDLTLPVYAGTPLAGTVDVRGRTGSYVQTLSVSVNYRFGD